MDIMKDIDYINKKFLLYSRLWRIALLFITIGLRYLESEQIVHENIITALAFIAVTLLAWLYFSLVKFRDDKIGFKLIEFHVDYKNNLSNENFENQIKRFIANAADRNKLDEKIAILSYICLTTEAVSRGKYDVAKESILKLKDAKLKGIFDVYYNLNFVYILFFNGEGHDAIKLFDEKESEINKYKDEPLLQDMLAVLKIFRLLYNEQKSEATEVFLNNDLKCEFEVAYFKKIFS